MSERHISSRAPTPDPFDEGARSVMITEEEFLKLLAEPVAQFFAHGFADLPADAAKWPARYFSLLAEKTHGLETFLDDYDARNNRRFSFLVELVASLRGLANVTQILQHIRVRFPKYLVRLEAEDMEHFQTSLMEAQKFATTSLSKLFSAVQKELNQLGLAGGNGGDELVAEPETPRERLPHDVDATDDTSEAKAAAVLSSYLEVCGLFQRAEGLKPPKELDALARFVEERYDEQRARAVEAKVHNVQSAYDTHIKFTAFEDRLPELRIFRGHISLALHLLEVGTLLVHFYERHENIIQTGTAKDRITELIDREDVLNHAVLFALYHAATIMVQARPIVTAALPHFVQHDEIEFELPEAGMLHARPLSLIVNIVRHHGTAVDLVIDGDSTVATSIMGLILFVGKHSKARTVSFRGDKRPLRDLKLLFENGLGENGLDNLPPELSYLKS